MKIKKLVSSKQGAIKYFVLQEVKNIYKIRNILHSQANCLEIERFTAFNKNSEWFRNEYINFIYELNANNHSFLWWSLELTTKSPLDSELCEKAFRLLIVKDLLKEQADHLLVITDDIALFEQVKINRSDLKIINAIEGRLDLKAIIKDYTPGFIICAFFRVLLFKFYTMLYRSFSINPNTDYTVIRSLLSEKSFAEDGTYSDTFLGKLYYYLAQTGAPSIIFATIFKPYRHNLKEIQRKAKAQNISVIPQEYYVSLPGIAICLIRALLKYYSKIKIKGDAKIKGQEVGYLVKWAIREDCRTHRFFVNLLSYYSTKSFLKKVRFNKLFYPFENRPWERMLLYAIRESRKNIKTVGYQHSAISLRHLNYMLGKDEHNILPLPDRVIATGVVTKEIMQDMGNFPAEILKVGCALRQHGLSDLGPTNRRSKISNILVILASSLDEHIQTLTFLNSVFSNRQNDYKICIRPHPTISFEEAKRLTPLLNFNFTEDKNKSIYESLKDADIVLYNSSTAGLEAIALGIPVIYIDLGDFINPDPLFNFSDFKWCANQPNSLIGIFKSIEGIPGDRFSGLQNRAKEYALKYFYPVNAENTKAFLESRYNYKNDKD
ncbi:MAG: hypothetical protein Q8R05_06840 [Candidatus Omnitrophota bacterium]|nr:hypothetical protein [Candidatus Omnitrophota bacterium]